MRLTRPSAAHRLHCQDSTTSRPVHGPPAGRLPRPGRDRRRRGLIPSHHLGRRQGHNIRWRPPSPASASLSGRLGRPHLSHDRLKLCAKAGSRPALRQWSISVQDTSPPAPPRVSFSPRNRRRRLNEIAQQGGPKVKRHPKRRTPTPSCGPLTANRRRLLWAPEGLYCLLTPSGTLWKQELGLLESAWFYDADISGASAALPIIYSNLRSCSATAGKNRSSPP